MKRTHTRLWPLLFMILLTSIVMLAQGRQTKPPAAGQPSIKVEGLITTSLNTAGGCGLPTFTLKTKEGQEYEIHLGTLKNAEGSVFTPMMGETITVAGTTCCSAANQNPAMVHAAEITLAKQVYRAPAGSMPGMMMGPGMGPGMMGHAQMAPGPMPAGQPGQGTMTCPGMTGQTAGQNPMDHAAMTPGATGPGTMACCNGTGAACAGCGMQPAAPSANAPADTK